MLNYLKSIRGINLKDFDFETFLIDFRTSVVYFLSGCILIGLGIITYKLDLSEKQDIKIIGNNVLDSNSEIIIEISGAVEKPGVYKVNSGSRINDILIASGGLSSNADRKWVDQNLNRASLLIDGQKVYIPSTNEQTNTSSANLSEGYQSISSAKSNIGGNFININTATTRELESLWGIGPIYAQKIIDHRPYSNVEELLTKGILKKNVYDKNVQLFSVY